MKNLLAKIAVKEALTLMPKSILSTAMGHATHLNAPSALHQAAARAFARAMKIETDDYDLQPDECATFADYFARPLKEGARPVAEGDDVVVSPVDGRVSAFGELDGHRMIQAKGRDYSAAALLDDPEKAVKFVGGTYLTLYLSPRDYHRIHAPLAGEISSASVIPGELFPVNAPSVKAIPNLFCVNERLITYLSTAAGLVAVVKVGATCVGCVRASYADLKTREGDAVREETFEPAIEIQKGGELGRFEMGSTVILLFEKGRVALDGRLEEGMKVKMGEEIARVVG